MTREKAAELAKIIQAYSEGKIIQMYIDGIVEGTGIVKGWKDIKKFDLDYLSKNDFFTNLLSFGHDISFKMNGLLRIKPEPKYVPFTFEDNLVGKIIIDNNGAIRSIINMQEIGGVFRGVSMDFISYNRLLNDFKFIDGTRCGKLIEE